MFVRLDILTIGLDIVARLLVKYVMDLHHALDSIKMISAVRRSYAC